MKTRLRKDQADILNDMAERVAKAVYTINFTMSDPGCSFESKWDLMAKYVTVIEQLVATHAGGK